MKRIITKNWLPLMVTFLVAFSITLVGAQVIKAIVHGNQAAEAEKKEEAAQDNENSDSNNNEAEPSATEPENEAMLNLQPLVDQWAKEVEASGRNRKIGVMIYDLDHSQTVASYHANETFSAASIYKLFFVYDGYRQLDQGLKKTNELFVNTSDRGRLTYGECLDLMVRESYNPCADPMRSDTEAYERVEKFIEELELQNTTDAGLYSTPADLVQLLKYLYQHENLSEESWQKLANSMLDQPPTTYDWRQGLPAGFNHALVYDKVGWRREQSYWAEYNDAAILEFPEVNRHYAVVVMTEGLLNADPIMQLGSQIEEAVLSIK